MFSTFPGNKITKIREMKSERKSEILTIGSRILMITIWDLSKFRAIANQKIIELTLLIVFYLI